MKRKPKADEVIGVTYDIIEQKMDLMTRYFDRHDLEWTEEGQIESRPGRIEWKVHLRSPPLRSFGVLQSPCSAAAIG